MKDAEDCLRGRHASRVRDEDSLGGEREGIGVFTVHMISNAHTLQARYSVVGCGSAGEAGACDCEIMATLPMILSTAFPTTCTARLVHVRAAIKQK